MKKKILVIAAHPDDEVLGCAGTIIKHTRAGDDVYCLILGEGITSRYNKRESAPESKIIELKQQTIETAVLLGTKEVYNADLPDNRFDSVPLLEIIHQIEKISKKIRPDIIYTHFQGDLNIDHKLTAQAVLTAFRPVKYNSVKEIYSFETLSSTEWSLQSSFIPNVYVDICDVIDKKIQACKIYKDELRLWPHPRSIQGIKVLAQKRGFEAGVNYAEGFMLMRSIR